MRLWRLYLLILILGFHVEAQEEQLGENALAGDNPPIYLADGFDMPVGTEAERQNSDVWASDWNSRWSFGIPQDGVLSAGIEIFAPGSAQRPIYVPASGLVIYAEDVYPFGNILIIRHDPVFRADAPIIYSRLGGLNRIFVSANSRVERGQILGESQSYLNFAMTESVIFVDSPLYQPESPRDLELLLNPIEFIAEHRPRSASRVSEYLWPVRGDMSQGFSERHPAIDIDAPEGSPIFATTEGLVIRRMDCRDCERIYPCRRQQYQDADLGFGYGNFLIVRYEGVLMPPELRRLMATYHARYAYLLYAHLSESFVDYGQMVDSDTQLATVGDSACVSAASLHLELRIGSDEAVDGRWQQQIPIDPFILFD